MLVTSLPTISAQQISVGKPAEHISLQITISQDGDIHVKHLVKKDKTVIQVNTISGTVSNLTVHDINGDEVQYAVIGGNTGVTIFPTDENVLVNYDLSDVLFLKDGIWTWSYFYPASSTFFFPKGVDLVFANERPVHLKDVEGMTCHGCNLNLEYIIDEPAIMKEVEWEGQRFSIYVRSLSEIGSFSFDQPSKKISFQVPDEKSFVTLIIPLKLLWNPYQVYLNDEKILKHEFSVNETHAWVNLRPQSEGTIDVIGTSVVPEFSMFLLLIMGMAIVIGLQFRTKISLH